jgi:hypothetical protein
VIKLITSTKQNPTGYALTKIMVQDIQSSSETSLVMVILLLTISIEKHSLYAPCSLLLALLCSKVSVIDFIRFIRPSAIHGERSEAKKQSGFLRSKKQRKKELQSGFSRALFFIHHFLASFSCIVSLHQLL